MPMCLTMMSPLRVCILNNLVANRNTEKLIQESIKKLEELDKKFELIDVESPKIKIEIEDTWGKDQPKFNDTW